MLRDVAGAQKNEVNRLGSAQALVNRVRRAFALRARTNAKGRGAGPLRDHCRKITIHNVFQWFNLFAPGQPASVTKASQNCDGPCARRRWDGVSSHGFPANQRFYPDGRAQLPMADIALAEQMTSVPDRAIAVRKGGARDSRFRLLTVSAALVVLGIFAGVMASLVIGALPAMRNFGWAFIYTEAWNPVTEKFGALASIYGTLITSLLAMLVAVPVGIGIAIFLTEICPRALRRPIGIAIELLAGIPSIIYGIWGLFIFAPWFQVHVQTALVDAFADVPYLRDFLGGPPYGIGIFTAALILSIMVLPFISAVTRAGFETVPPGFKEAAYAPC